MASVNTQTEVTCNAACDGTVTITASGGLQPYTFDIGMGLLADSSFTGLCAGAYTVVVTDANMCPFNVAVTITEPAALNANILSQIDIDCFGNCNGSVNITTTGGTAPLSFDMGLGAQTDSAFTALCGGPFNVTVTDNNNCTFVVAVNIIEPTALTATASTVSNVTGAGLCDGEVIVAVGGGTTPYVFDWSGAGLTPNAISTDSLCSGSYCVDVTDSLGCTVNTCTPVTEPGAIIITSIDVMVDCFANCNGTISATMNGGVTPYVYAWTGPNGFTSALEDLTALCAGTYDLTLTDSNGIQATYQTTITEPTALVPGITSTDALCNGVCAGTEDLTITGGTGAMTIAWTGPNGYTSANEDNAALCAGTYDVTITDANNCVITDQVIISEPTAIVSPTSNVNSNCGQADGSVDVVPTGGTVAGAYGYDWQDAAGNSVGATSTVTGLTAGVYTVYITDDNNCVGTATTTITDIGGGAATAVVTSNFNGAEISCNGLCDGEITVTMTGGTTPYAFVNNLGTSQTSAIFSDLCDGNQSVVVTDAVGCISTVQIMVTEPTALGLSSTVVDETCAGDCNGSLDLIATGGTGAYNYSIDACATSQAATLFANLCNGQYTTCITDINGCQLSNNETVAPGIAFADASITAVADMCIDGGLVNLSAATGGGIWSGNGVVNGAPGSFNPSTAGPGTSTIYYTVTTACPDSDSITVTVFDLPVVSFIADIQSGCEALDVVFTNTGDTGNCTWTMDGTTQTDCATVPYTFTTAGTYDISLTITDGNGCVNSLNEVAFIEVFAIPMADFMFSPLEPNILTPTIDYTNYSIGASTYAWDFNGLGTSTDVDPSFPYDEAGTYITTLVVTSPAGCQDSVSQEIIVLDEFLFYVPNTFTPDGDGINDVFLPILNGADPLSYNLFIFNRWGELIFESYSLTKGWDGTYKGMDAQVDTYVWKILVDDAISGKKKEFIGHVNAIR
ncbi:MAG: hypothetical protein COB65_12255 [Thalassobium sp.]|nr:MAG: hypothetical protein COB65_12255 [Thalassobium sp.]